MSVPQRKITKKKAPGHRSGRYVVLADGKEVGFIVKQRYGGWAYLTSSGWHRTCHTLRAAFKGAENHLNCRLPGGLR